MRLTNSEETYGLIHQVLHWTTAGLILFMLPLGFFMYQLPIETQLEIDFKIWLYSLHKSVGIAALFVALARITWAAMQPHPRLMNHGNEAIAAQTIHFLLYALIIAVPVFGWLHHAATTGYAPIWWWGIGDTLPFVPKNEAVAHFLATAHWLAAIGLVLSLVLHIGGAIKHAVIDKDMTLQRMVPGAYVETGILPPKKATGRTPLGLASLAILLGATAIAVVHFGFGADRAVAIEAAQVETQTPPSQAATATAPSGVEANWVIDPQNSSITVSVAQMGSDVQGSFGSFEADVLFDPQAPEAARIEARIPVATFTFGSNTDQALSADFLNAEVYPVAVFTSQTVTKTESGYRAEGELALAGTTQPVTLDFTFDEVDGVANVEATATLQRLEFGIGKAYQGNDTVGHSVRVAITLVANRK
ncbi:YceI family protein [Pseudahrensia aquimaris]|uniref:YceI family protein n=1 Tax=Pseudahrensia aquimaris TaxID=744461 RepID=A0ABW3FD36_9HYPH